MRESTYERKLKDKLRDMFPGCFLTKPDPREHQGVPDILILFKNKWAMLEVKMDGSSPVQPNQPYYVEKFRSMSFAAFINPQTEDEVLNALSKALGA